jgi:hypothetical protein
MSKKKGRRGDLFIMKILLYVISVMFFLAGLVFFLQGINVLPGSYMSGDPKWAVNGAIGILLGIGLFWFANRRRG